MRKFFNPIPMNRVRQGDKWLTPTENEVFMAERFKKEHGLTLKGKKIEKETSIDKVVVESATPAVVETTSDGNESAPAGETPAPTEAETPTVLAEPTPTKKKRGRPPKAK